MLPTRRGFLTGLVAALSAPAIVRVENIMPVRALFVSPALVLPPKVFRTADLAWLNVPEEFRPLMPESAHRLIDYRAEHGRVLIGEWPVESKGSPVPFYA